MDAVIDMADPADALDLARIRFQLMCARLPTNHNLRSRMLIYTRSRLEDTITFHLIERVQFALNSVSC